MEKPDSLRKALERAFPSLADDPAMLIFEIEKGNIEPMADVMTFYINYELIIYLMDYGDPIYPVIAHIINWLQLNQPDLIRNPDKRTNGFRFEANPIDHGKTDYLITLQLKEHVIVQVDKNGHLQIDIKPEPNHYKAPLA